MKKFLGLIFALIISISAVFADNYNGDFQLNFGAGFDSMTATMNTYTNSYGNTYTNLKNLFESGLFSMNLESWHVFGSNDVFKFGFMVAADECLGGTTKYGQAADNVPEQDADPDDRLFAYRLGLFIAPAFSFFIGDVVRFNVAPGLSILYLDAFSLSSSSYDYTIFYTPAIGFGCEVQAKFCPNSKVSPVLSYRFTTNFAKDLYTLDTNNLSTDSTQFDSIVIFTHTFNVGISWNW